MEIYFIRHAIAVDREDPEVSLDAERWLTKKGISRMEQIARTFAKLVIELDQIVTSPYVRAKHTAEILADAFEEKVPVIVSDHLRPDMDADDFIHFLREQSSNTRIALVGHEPDLSSLISILVFGTEEGQIQMGKGAIARVDISGKPDRAAGTLVWLIQPKVTRTLFS